VIELADCLTIQAANSLLKTLEEPPDAVSIILVASTPERLVPTVRSRCQRLRLPLPTHDAGQAWLKAQGRAEAADLLELAGGCPERAVVLADEGIADHIPALASDIVQLLRGAASAPSLAARWANTPLATLMFANDQLVADCLRAKAGGRAAVRLPANDALLSVVTPLPWRVLYAYSDELTALRRAREQPLNETLALERLFLGWSGIVGAALSNTG
jgi:DNA polymerase-3 subunit delta'